MGTIKHPEQDAIRFARGKTVADLPSLQHHLAHCQQCSELVLFVQKLSNFVRSKQATQTERPDIDRKLEAIGLDRKEAAEMVRRLADKPWNDAIAEQDARKQVAIGDLKANQQVLQQQQSTIFDKIADSVIARIHKSSNAIEKMEGLSREEKNLLHDAALGLGADSIARDLGITESSVKSRFVQLCNKLGILIRPYQDFQQTEDRAIQELLSRRQQVERKVPKRKRKH